jgi:hypothetical protein
MPNMKFTPRRTYGSPRTRLIRKDEPQEEVPVQKPDYPFEEGQRVYHKFRGEGTVTHPRPNPEVSFVEVDFDNGSKHLCFPESLYPL